MAVDRARRDLEKFRSEAERLQARLDDLGKTIQKLTNYIEMALLYEDEGQTHKNIVRMDGGELPPNRSGVPPRNVSMVVEILRNAKRPMRTKELVDRLAQQGLAIQSKNPVTNLSGALSRWKGLLIPNRSDGWSLVEWVDNGADAVPGISDADATPEATSNFVSTHDE